jgi:hypothetical protein
MDILQRSINAVCISCNLTGFMLGTIRHDNSLDSYTREQMARELIDVHEKHPIDNSARWVEQWKEEFKDILNPVHPLEVANPVHPCTDDLPF